MKYFSPSYWFKLWLLSAHLFSDQTKNTNAMLIDKNKEIKNWANKNSTSLNSVLTQSNFINSSIENITNNQFMTNQDRNIEQFNQTNLDLPRWDQNLTTIGHKHRHGKSRRSKRGVDGGNEIEFSGGLIQNVGTAYCSFKPDFWEEIVYLKINNNKENFVNQFKDKMYSGVWKDYRIDSSYDMENIAKVIYDNFWTIANKFIDSSRKERIRIVIEFGRHFPNGEANKFTYISTNIRTSDKNFYHNGYLDNLKRDFPIWNSYETYNLGLINFDNSDNIKNAIKKQNPNFIRLEEISVVDKEDYSHFCECFKAKLYSSRANYYSFGNLRPTFSYTTQTKLNELNDKIANDPKVKQWLQHINDYDKNLPNKINQLKTYTENQKWIVKSTEKEIIKGYIRDWSYVSTLIEHEWKLDELNKNVQGLKANFDFIKNQINELDNRVKNLENTSNWNCANIATVGTAAATALTAITVSASVPVFGAAAAAVGTLITGACAIAGV